MSRIVAYTSKSWKLDIVMMIPMTDLWRKREKTGQQRHSRLIKEDWKGSRDSYLRIMLEIQMLSLSSYTNLSYHKARIFVVWKAPGNAGALRLEIDKLGGNICVRRLRMQEHTEMMQTPAQCHQSWSSVVRNQLQCLEICHGLLAPKHLLSLTLTVGVLGKVIPLTWKTLNSTPAPWPCRGLGNI